MAASFASSAQNSAVAQINGLLPQRDIFIPQEVPAYSSIKAYGPLLDHVFSIRYESYSAEDYIEKNPAKRFMDEFDGKKKLYFLSDILWKKTYWFHQALCL